MATKNKDVEVTINMLAFLVITLITMMTLYTLGTWIDRRQARVCPKYQYVYRPYQRTFIEEQTKPTSVFKLYQSMFWQQSPWVSTHANPEANSTGRINPYVWGDLPKTELGVDREPDDYLNSAF